MRALGTVPQYADGDADGGKKQAEAEGHPGDEQRIDVRRQIAGIGGDKRAGCGGKCHHADAAQGRQRRSDRRIGGIIAAGTEQRQCRHECYEAGKYETGAQQIGGEEHNGNRHGTEGGCQRAGEMNRHQGTFPVAADRRGFRCGCLVIGGVRRGQRIGLDLATRPEEGKTGYHDQHRQCHRGHFEGF